MRAKGKVGVQGEPLSALGLVVEVLRELLVGAPCGCHDA
jgi:hypothetical protein